MYTIYFISVVLLVSLAVVSFDSATAFTPRPPNEAPPLNVVTKAFESKNLFFLDNGETSTDSQTSTTIATDTNDLSIPYDAAAKLAYSNSDKSMKYEDFKVQYESSAVADVIAKNTPNVDLSIPYDAPAQLAYSKSDKAMKYEDFKEQYESDAVAEVIAKNAPPYADDLSIPYDAAAKLAYTMSSMSIPYEEFKVKYENDAVRQIKTKRQQKIQQQINEEKRKEIQKAISSFGKDVWDVQPGVPSDVIRGAALTGASLSVLGGKGLAVTSIAGVCAAYFSITAGKVGKAMRSIGGLAWKTTQKGYDLYSRNIGKFGIRKEGSMGEGAKTGESMLSSAINSIQEQDTKTDRLDDVDMVVSHAKELLKEIEETEKGELLADEVDVDIEDNIQDDEEEDEEEVDEEVENNIQDDEEEDEEGEVEEEIEDNIQDDEEEDEEEEVDEETENNIQDDEEEDITGENDEWDEIMEDSEEELDPDEMARLAREAVEAFEKELDVDGNFEEEEEVIMDESEQDEIMEDSEDEFDLEEMGRLAREAVEAYGEVDDDDEEEVEEEDENDEEWDEIEDSEDALDPEEMARLAREAVEAFENGVDIEDDVEEDAVEEGEDIISENEWEESIRLAQSLEDDNIIGIEDSFVDEKGKSEWDSAGRMARDMAGSDSTTVSNESFEEGEDELDPEELARLAREAVEAFEREVEMEQEGKKQSWLSGADLENDLVSQPTKTDWSKLTVAQLKEELKLRGLPATGRKAQLIETLEAFENSSNNEEDLVMDDSDEEDLLRMIENIGGTAAEDVSIMEPSDEELFAATEEEPDLEELGRAAREAVEMFDNQDDDEFQQAPLSPQIQEQEQETTTDWNKMTVNELKEELRSRGLKVSGRKAELIERLKSF